MKKLSTERIREILVKDSNYDFVALTELAEIEEHIYDIEYGQELKSTALQILSSSKALDHLDHQALYDVAVKRAFKLAQIFLNEYKRLRELI